jgi:hypothetical protein
MDYKVGDKVVLINDYNECFTKQGKKLSRFTLHKEYKIINIYSDSFTLLDDNGNPDDLFKLRFKPYRQYIFEEEMKDIINE